MATDAAVASMSTAATVVHEPSPDATVRATNSDTTAASEQPRDTEAATAIQATATAPNDDGSSSAVAATAHRAALDDATTAEQLQRHQLDRD
jgi:hypothetical protein